VLGLFETKLATNIVWEKVFPQVYHSQIQAAKFRAYLNVAPAAISEDIEF
jgi:hypothetical protein